MDKCVNINSVELKQLAETTGISAIDLAIEIGMYQDKNNTDEFPTVEYLQANTSLPYNDAIPEFKAKYHIKEIYSDVNKVNEILKSARDNTKYDQIQFGIKSSSSGFSIAFNPKYGKQTTLLQQNSESQRKEVLPELQTAVSNYFEAIGVKLSAVDKIYFNGKEVDANAKANTLTKTVEYVEGKLQRDTLPEEAGHIWVDMAGGENNPMILKMMNDVTKFKIYEQVVAEYSELYKGNDILLRKEAVGKVIASYMLNQFTGEPTLDELGKSWFEKLWMKIKSFFVGNKFKGASLDILKAKVGEYNTPSDTAGEFLQVNEESKEEPVEEEENIHKRQYIFFKRRIAFLESQLKSMNESDSRFERYNNEVTEIKKLFEEAQKEQDYLELANRTLDKVEKFIERLSTGDSKITAEVIGDTYGVLGAFSDYAPLAGRVKELENKLFPFGLEWSLEQINNYSTEPFPITEEMLNKQKDDIASIVASTGAVANSSNYIVRTIGAIIKDAQNRVSVENKKATHEVQEAVDKLEAWATSKGMALPEAYEIFIQEYKETLVLTQKRLEDGTPNPNWKKIQSTPELLEFYSFFQRQTRLGGERAHTRIGRSFIPNVKKKVGIIQKFRAEDIINEESQLTLNEEFFADIVSNKAYRNKLKPEEKSKDLGEVLLKFVAFSNRYSEMSKVLPQTRVLQKQLELKRTKNGDIVERSFIKSTTLNNKKKIEIPGIQSNRWSMVDQFIQMQVKGQMKKDEGKIAEVADQIMSYNSLLRIGLSPITAISNIVYGDISNFIESIGGRFYTTKDLHQASLIFANESLKEGSKTNILLELINPLQELSDYENISKVRINRKMSAERIKEFMYSPQKMGEKWLQTRTMIALMHHEKIKSIDGKSEVSLWEVFNADGSIKEGYSFDEKQVAKLRDKIQRLNEMIHGRYSSRDAGVMSQNVLYRLVSQFRKWIPTQVENRIMRKYHDNRLGVDVEGRYHTFNRTFIQELRQKNVGKAFYNLFTPLVNAKAALESGTLTEMEIYNMRKMLVEIIMALGSIMIFALVGGDDDKKKDPLVKFGLTLLNRASADLTFFYSASEINNLGKNAIPITKLVGDLIDVVTVIPEVLYTGESVISRGSNKGRYKIEKEVVDVVPILNPIFGQMRRIMSENKLEELN